MNFSQAKKEFEIRYYVWATSEFEKEIEESFPILRSFKAGSAWKTYQFMLQLSKEDQLILARSLLKRFHPNAVKALGETCSVDEELLRSRRDVAFSNIVSFGEEIRARKNAGEPVKLASKRKLLRVMKTKFEEAFAHECIDFIRQDEDMNLRFKIQRAGWIVNTFFDFGRSRAVLNYFHNIESGKSLPNQVWEHGMGKGMGAMMSFNSCLGIASQTEWSYLTEEEIDCACAIALSLCARFFNILPKLLKGLEYETVNEFDMQSGHP